MYLIYFRYGFNVIRLKHLKNNKNFLIIIPKDNEVFYKEEGYENIICLDNYDHAEIIKHFNKYREDNKIKGVIGLAEEDIEIIGYLNQLNNSDERFQKFYNSILFRDKLLMRGAVDRIILQPCFYEGQNNSKWIEKIIKKDKKIISKPRSMAASSGIYTLEKVEEFRKDNFSILEQYQTFDTMYTYDGVAKGDQVLFGAVHEYDKKLFESIGREAGFSIHSNFEENIKNHLSFLSKKILSVLNPDGAIIPFHFEWFYNKKNKKFYFCEVAARFGGGRIPDIIENEYGIDIIKLYYYEIFKDVLGIEEHRVNNCVFTGVYLAYREEGKVVELPEIPKYKWIKYFKFFVEINKEYIAPVNVIENSFIVEIEAKDKVEYLSRLEIIKKEVQAVIKYEKSNKI